MSESVDIFKLEWFYIDSGEKEPKGPISIRDIDVLMRTNGIDSSTYVWREGMDDWKKIFQIDELKDIANLTHTEIQESLVRTKIQNSYNHLGQKIENTAVDNYYFGADGFWHVYNPVTKIWTSQEKKPNDRRKSIDNLQHNEGEDEEEMFQGENVNAYYKRLERLNKLERPALDDQSIPFSEIKKNTDGLIVQTEKITSEVENNLTNTTLNNNHLFLNKKRKASTDPEITEITGIRDPIEAQTNLTEKELGKIEKRKKKKEKQKDKRKQQWYMPKVNANIYVSNLPKDITQQELVEYFSRCGFIRKDQRTNENKIKLYKDQNGKNKGDALISFLREESVTMAVEMLNETEIRPGYKINVEKAQFEQKGDYKARESYKLDYIQRYKMKTEVDRMLGWNEEDDEKGLMIVILKNMFEPRDFQYDPALRHDLELDIIEEAESNFGQVDKFLIFEDHPEGIVKIKFHTPAGAEKCINMLHQRYYNGRCIEAFYWDGKTDYTKFNEDQQDQEKRIDDFGTWLETENK